MGEFSSGQFIAAALTGIVVTAFIFRLVLGINQLIDNQKRIIKVLEGIFKQNGGDLDDLLPEVYRDKRKEPNE